MRATLLSLSLLLGCGGASESASAGPRSVAEPDPPAAAMPSTAYRVGDEIVYRYSGSFSAEPVSLREQILEVEGLRLVIEVTATRGAETRRWRQHVTDTEENRNADRIDALYEVVDGEPRLLANEDNRDAYRLYEWTIPSCSGAAENGRRETRGLSVAGRSMDCVCSIAEQSCDDQPSVATFCDCPELVWTHALGDIRAAEAERPYWRMEVVRVGGAAAPPAPE